MFGAPRKSGPQARPVPAEVRLPEKFLAAHREGMAAAPRADHSVAPTESRMSDAYARAQAEFDEMKQRLEAVTQERDELRVAIKVEQGENQRLADHIDRVEDQRDVLQRRVNEIETRFDDVGALIMRIFDTRMTKRQVMTEVDMRSMEDEVTNAQRSTDAAASEGRGEQTQQPNGPRSGD